MHYEMQGDSGGRVSILGGDSIGHYEKRISYVHVSNSEWLVRYSCWNLQIQKHWNGNEGKEITFCCYNFNFDVQMIYEGHLESKERFAIQRYLLIIRKKQNMQVLSHTFTYFST